MFRRYQVSTEVEQLAYTAIWQAGRTQFAVRLQAPTLRTSLSDEGFIDEESIAAAAVAEIESIVEPDGIGNDIRWDLI